MSHKRNRLIIIVAVIVVVALGAVGCPRLVVARQAAEVQLPVDLSKPIADGYAVETTVLPVSSDWALLYLADAKRLAEPEPGRIYGLNMKTGKLSSEFLVTGRIVSSAGAAHSDGTLSLVINTGGKLGLIFVDPRTLAVTKQALPEGLDIWNLAVSPDKRQVAYTLFEGTYVANLDFSDPRCLLPRDPGTSDSDGDDELARVNAWSADGTQIVYWRCGYEWLIGTGLWDVKTGQDRFVQLLDKAGYLTVDNQRLLVCDVVGYDFGQAAFGVVDLNIAPPEYREVAKWGMTPESVDFGHDGKYAGICGNDPTPQVRVLTVNSGTIVATLDVATGLRAASIVLVPTGDAAAVVTLDEANGYRPGLILWRFLNDTGK